MWCPATPDGKGQESKKKGDNWQRSSMWHLDEKKATKQGVQGWHAKILSAAHREESTSAGSQASNGQGNGWDHLRKVGPGDQKYATKGMQMRLSRTKRGSGVQWARRERRGEAEIQISEDCAEGRAERLDGGRVLDWQRPVVLYRCKARGGLTVSHHAVALPVGEAWEGGWESQVSTRPYIGCRMARFTDVNPPPPWAALDQGGTPHLTTFFL